MQSKYRDSQFLNISELVINRNVFILYIYIYKSFTSIYYIHTSYNFITIYIMQYYK